VPKLPPTRFSVRLLARYPSLRLSFRRFDDRISFAVDADGEYDRTTADGAVLDEPLVGSGRRIHANVVLLAAIRARVGASISRGIFFHHRQAQGEQPSGGKSLA